MLSFSLKVPYMDRTVKNRKVKRMFHGSLCSDGPNFETLNFFFNGAQYCSFFLGPTWEVSLLFTAPCQFDGVIQELDLVVTAGQHGGKNMAAKNNSLSHMVPCKSYESVYHAFFINT